MTRSSTCGVAGLGLLLIGSTVGEGGATPTALLAWHAGLAVLVLLELLAPTVDRGIARAPAGAFWAYFAIALVGAVRAPYGFAAWLFLLELGCFASVAWLASRLGPELIARLSTPLLLAGSAQALLALLQRFAWPASGPAAGSLLNTNHLAAWLLAITLVAWADPLSRREVPGRRPMVALLSTGLILVAIAASGSRGALIGLVAGSMVVTARAWPSWPLAWRRGVVAAGLVAAIVLGAGIALRQRQDDPFRYQRARIWAGSLRVLADRPLFGSGPRQFADASRRYQFPDGDGPLLHDRGFRTTHSDWLRVPCELGWPGAAALLGAIVLGLRAVPRSSLDGRLGALAALAALGAQAAVENLSTRPAVYLLAAALAGVALSERRERSVALAPGLRLAGAAMLVVVFAIGDVAPYLGWLVSRTSNAGAGTEARLPALDRAIERNPVHPDYWRRRAARLADGAETWDLATYAAAREAAETAVRLDPAGADFHREVARVEARACRELFHDRGTRDRAAAAYARAEALDPFNPFLPLELGGLLLDTGDASGAVAAATRALDLEPEAVSPRLLLAAALLASGAPDGSTRAAELLAEAREASRRWGGWAERGDYARNLLTLDAAAVARIERELGLGATGESGGRSLAMHNAPG